MSFADQVRTQFDHLLTRSQGTEKTFRQKAWDQYALLGLPGRKTESWKYSSLNKITLAPWALSEDAALVNPRVRQLIEQWSGEFEIIFVGDGGLRPELSTFKSSPGAALSALSFDDAQLDIEDGFAGLSAALSRPGFHLQLADQYCAPKPVLIIHAQSGASTWSPLVNRISLGAKASLELAEIHLGEGGRYLRSQITSVDVAEGALLNWVRVQQEGFEAYHFSEVQSRLAAGAQLSLTQLNGGAAWCRSNLRTEIRGERAEAHINGLTFARGDQHIDQRVEARHLKGNSSSAQLFKGVLKDRARGVLNGKILIERDAQKVISSQLNHNLLLSSNAEADTKPELEIYADDVKANHGASIGRLDENKMFYLMSRGITRQVAQQMLAHAFVGDVLMKIGPKRLRRFADTCVQSWLPEFSSDMEHTLDGALQGART